MRGIGAAIAAVVLLAGAGGLAQTVAPTAEMRALREAEGGLRDVLLRMERGGVGSAEVRQALDSVERAMRGLPDQARRGTTWDTATREVSEARALLSDRSASAEAVRQAAGEALATLPALRGEETGTGGS